MGEVGGAEVQRLLCEKWSSKSERKGKQAVEKGWRSDGCVVAYILDTQRVHSELKRVFFMTVEFVNSIGETACETYVQNRSDLAFWGLVQQP